MKLLYIHQHFSTPEGSAGTRSYEFAKRLVAKGHQVTMVCGTYLAATTGLTNDFHNNVRRGIVAGFEVVEIGVHYSNKLSFLKRIKQFIYFAYKVCYLIKQDHVDFDFIYATSTPLTVGLPALYAKFFKKKPYVFEVRDLWPELPKAMGQINNSFLYWSLQFFEWTVYRFASHCVALAPGIADGIAKKLGTRRKITLIPNGSDIDYFSTGVAKALPGFSSEDFICIFAGTHGLANGLEAVLDVAAILKDQQPHIKFLFVGDGKLKLSLVKRATKEKLTNCVFWDLIPKQDLPNVFKSVQLGLMILKNIPSFYFGTSPNKFFDYIASGLPVLNNYPGWLKGLIEKNKCGVYVPPNDPNAFAKALIALSADRKQLEMMRLHAYDLALSRFDRDVLTQKFIALLERIDQQMQGCVVYEEA